MVVAVVQARFASSRLPGKVLRPLRGRPMIGYLLESLAHSRTLDGVVVATSTDPTDDAIANFAQARDMVCYRGPLEDVASRVLEAGRSVGADAVVRVSGDSPLLDPALVDAAVTLFRQDAVDLATNIAVRTFPRGQSVEVMACDALERALRQMTTSHEREHVTAYFYSHPEQFSIRSFTAARPRSDVRLSVDDPADFARCEAILDALGRPPWDAGWEACVRAHDHLTERLSATSVPRTRLSQ